MVDRCICCVFGLKLGHSCLSIRWCIIVVWSPFTNLLVSDIFSQVSASIRPNSILYWPSVSLERICDAPNYEYRRKQWTSPWLLSDFDVVFFVSACLLSFILMTVNLFACQICRPMSLYQLWCVPWVWDQNWRDPACLTRPAHTIVLEENSDLLELAVRRRVLCQKYPPKSNEQTRERCWSHGAISLKL